MNLYYWLILLAGLIILVVVLYFFRTALIKWFKTLIQWFKNQRAKNTTTPIAPGDTTPSSGEKVKSPREIKIARGEFVGKHISAFRWNVAVRPVLSLLVALPIVTLLYTIDWFLATEIIDWMIAGALIALFATIFGMSDEETTVPFAHAAMLTWFGMRLRLYRTEGNYYWTGKKLLLGHYVTPKNRGNDSKLVGTDENGFINLGEIQITIWDRQDAKDKPEKAVIEMVASDQTTIKATLVLVIRLLDPVAWTTSENPLLDIAERTRSAFRTAASFFTGIDNAAIKSVLGTLMSGKTIITSFIPKVYASYPKGTMIRDRGGAPLYHLDETSYSTEEAKKAALQKLVEEFRDKLPTVADVKMLKILKVGKNYHIEAKTVEEAIEEVVEASGAKLVRASVGTIILPDKVRTAAEQTASEASQREGQVASAKAFAEAKKIMDKAKTPGDEVAAAIAASADNPNVKVVFVPGADPLTRAAVAAATQIKP